jgi:hypothetical protein
MFAFLAMKPMTKEQTLEIFGGPKGQTKAVLEQLWPVLEKRKSDAETKKRLKI